jgi:hypothetical protein
VGRQTRRNCPAMSVALPRELVNACAQWCRSGGSTLNELSLPDLGDATSPLAATQLRDGLLTR